MSQSNLEISRDDLERRVAFKMGFGYDPELWTDADKQFVQDCIDDGLREFYFPASAPGYIWRFLQPIVTIVTKADTDSYVMPDDFAAWVDGELTFAANEGFCCQITGEAEIRRRQQSPVTGPPTIAGMRPIYTDGGGTRWQITFFPTPDGVYNLSGRYSIAVDTVDVRRPYPYGGVQHTQTIIYACLAAAEMSQDHTAGPMSEKFAGLLQASLIRDRDLISPENLGRNGNGRPGYFQDRAGWYREGARNITLTSGGVVYGGP